MQNTTAHHTKTKNPISWFLSKFKRFWIFLCIFKLGASLHFTILAPLGEKVLPVWIVWFVIGAAAGLQLVLDIPAWYMLDKYWYRKMLKITTVIFMIAAWLLLYELTIATFILTTMIATLWWLFFWPWASSYTLSHSPKSHAGEFLSLKDVFQSTWVVLSTPFIIYALNMHTPLVGLIILWLLFIALICIFLSPKDTVSVHAEKKIETHHYYIKDRKRVNIREIMKWLNPVSTTMVLTNFWSGLFYAIIWFVVPLLMQQEASNQVLWRWLGMFDLAIMILWWVIGKFTDKYDKKMLILCGMVLFAVTGSIIWFNFNILFLILWFMATTGDEIAWVSLRSWLSHIQKDHTNDGKISAVIHMASDLGRAIWPMLAWVLYYLIWPSRTITIGWAILFIITCIYYGMLKYYAGEHPMPRPAHNRPHKWRHKN